MIELCVSEARVSGHGPTMSEGHIMEVSFSRWRVTRRLDLEEPAEDSMEEYEEVMLRMLCPGESARGEAALDWGLDFLR